MMCTVFVAALLLAATAHTAVVNGADGEPVPRSTDSDVDEPYVTALVRLKDLSPEERDRLLNRALNETCDCVLVDADTIVITGVRSEIERLLRRPIR